MVIFNGCIGKKTAISNESNGSISFSTPQSLTETSVGFTVNYKNAKEISLSSSDVQLIKTGTVDGQVSISGAGLSSRLITVHSITGVGTLAVKLAAGTAMYSKTKKASALGPSPVFVVEHLVPVITISSPSALRTKSGPVSFTVNYSGASFIYLDETFISLNTSNTATGTVVVSGTGTTSRTVTISGITGEGTLGFQIAADSAVSSAGVYSVIALSPVFTDVDTTPPAITISAPSSATTKSGPVSYTINYTESPTISLSAADVTLNKTGTADGVVTVTGSGSATRTVTITSITGDGTLGISLAANTAIDAVGNSALAPAASSTFTTDNTAPSVTLSAPSLATTNTGPVTYTATYTGASSISLTTASVTLNKTGTANGTVTISGTGSTTRTITISGIVGDGTIGISLVSGTASDLVANLAPAPAASTTFSIDNTSSGISFSAPSVTDSNTGPVTYTVTYTDAASISLIDSDVQLIKTGTANAVATVSGTGSVNRTITVSSITGAGTIAVKLIAGTAIDTTGNTALASSTSTAFNVDNTPPTMTISSPSLATTNTGPVTYTVTYTGASAITLADGDIVINKTGTADAVATVTGSGTTTRTVTLNAITGDGTLKIQLAAGTASDAAGNISIASSLSSAFTVDNTRPIVTFAAPSKKGVGGGTSYTIVANYSGASAVNLTAGNISLTTTDTATATVAVSGSGTASRTITLSAVSGHGKIRLTMAAGTASDAAGNTTLAPTASEYVYISNDPLFFQTWHLYNTGQNGFSSGVGTAGVDLGLLNTWMNNTLGLGVKVLVSDTGVQAAHEDLAANFLGGTVSHDYVLGSSPDWSYATAEPVIGNNGDSHGTAVAGIIAAVAGNGLGGQGVAPLAKIASANILESTFTVAEVLTQLDNTFDIINQSWGVKQCTIGAPIAAYESKLKSDRKIYIKSAGNDFYLSLADCGGAALTRNGNSVFDYFNNNPYTIIVGAVSANGFKSSYSSPGSNIWISGFGGEYGDTKPAIITTDLIGCTDGMSPNDNVNAFQLSSHPLNTNCNYTSIMNGTSSAAPTISGVVALMLSANPALTARDVKNILALTATNINSAAGNSNHPIPMTFPSPTGHVYQQGWVANAAGIKFHNYYGFGLVNADAAVSMASTGYTLIPAEVQTGYTASAALAAAIPDASAAGVENTISIAANYIIEGVQIKTDVTHPDIGQIGIELTSPSGTKSILVNINNALEGQANLSTEVFLTNAFFGENSAGNWKVKLIDGKSGSTGTLNSWQINVIGH